MTSPNDVYVAVNLGRKSIRYSVRHKSKEHFCDLGIDRILFNPVMHCTVNTGFTRFEI